jgi:hypothetical protein
MNGQQTPAQMRDAVAAGIIKGVTHILFVALCFWGLFTYPLAALGLVLAALGLWLAWQVLRWLLPSTWRARAADRQYKRDRDAFRWEHPYSCSILMGYWRLRDYEECKARMQREGAHPDNWRPFEEWRAARRRS